MKVLKKEFSHRYGSLRASIKAKMGSELMNSVAHPIQAELY
jgi:hypothetical protein